MILVQLAAMLMSSGQPTLDVVAEPPVAKQEATVTQVQAFNRLDIPPALMAPLFPYIRCLSASWGIEQHMNGQVLPPPEGISIGSDCSRYRSRTIEMARQALLRQQVTNVDERTAIIERTLSTVERHFDGYATPAAGGERAEQSLERLEP